MGTITRPWEALKVVPKPSQGVAFPEPIPAVALLLLLRLVSKPAAQGIVTRGSEGEEGVRGHGTGAWDQVGLLPAESASPPLVTVLLHLAQTDPLPLPLWLIRNRPVRKGKGHRAGSFLGAVCFSRWDGPRCCV